MGRPHGSGTSGRILYPEVLVGGILDICLHEAELQTEIRAGGQGQDSSSYMRTKEKLDIWNRNLEWDPEQETGPMSMVLRHSWQERVGLETWAFILEGSSVGGI